jgi:hypothetical protein
MVITGTVQAIETDQFIAATVSLKDSSPLINNYIREKMHIAVSKANRRGKGPAYCQKLASNVFTEILGRFSISKISRYAEEAEEFERFPSDDLSMGEYMDLSIYQMAKFPINMVGLSHTINVGGIYVGTDKLGHFALLGRNYYNRYRKYNRRMKDSVAAQKKSIMKGIRQEVSLLGYTLGGVLSFADLEANYQGLRFGIEMCQGENAFLQFADNQWQINTQRPFDIMEYFNPKMDETFNLNFWRPNLWKKINPDVAKVYCSMLESPLYKNRLDFYQSINVPSYNDELMAEFLINNPKFDRSTQTIECL